MRQLEKAILYLDASVEAQHALETAIYLSKISGATIIAVNIVDQHVVTNLARQGDRSLAEIEVELEENGWRYLYAAEETAKNVGARIVILQEQGYPEELLPRLASEYQADVVIVGQDPRARSDVARRRTAEQLMEHTPCALMIVR
jgi:nucleotide-binding universal stress UspA family protein